MNAHAHAHAQYKLDKDKDGADDEGFKAGGRKKKGKKHKLSITAGREYFIKKPNLASSPQL